MVVDQVDRARLVVCGLLFNVIDHENGISYIDRYFDYLARRIGVLIGAGT